MKVNILPSAVVITPTTLSSKLIDAVTSVNEQTYGNVHHWVVVDGKQFLPGKEEGLLDSLDNDPDIDLYILQNNTGEMNGQKFYGHRIYAGFSQLVNSDYVFFLDEDNWYSDNHVKSCIDFMQQNQRLDFCYSLRSIFSKDKEFIAQDNCESLGKWPIWCFDKPSMYMVDTSCYCFKRQFLANYGHLWFSGWGGDRAFFNAVMNDSYHDTTGLYTMNYRLDANPNSVKPEFFLQGNDVKRLVLNIKAGDKFPWQK